MRQIQQAVQHGIDRCASTPLFFYTTIWLIILLVLGTLAQKELGLYLADRYDFSSFYFLLYDVIPLPGGYTTLTIVTINLIARIINDHWTMQKLGTLVIHMGALLLLVGGMFTALFSSEGAMVIAEGERASFIEDYHARDLVVIDHSTTPPKEVQVIPVDALALDKPIAFAGTKITITPIHIWKNIALIRRAALSEDVKFRGMARAIDMREAPTEKLDEGNVYGIVFQLHESEQDGTYSIFESMPIQQTITIDDTEYSISLRKKRTYLPFEIELINFEKRVHPGTSTPRAYQSEIVLHDNGLSWHSLIEMNAPLRYKGYTFFQSSFVQTTEGEITILAVVHNIGRLFPYIASIIMCFGLLIHLWQRIPSIMRKRDL